MCIEHDKLKNEKGTRLLISHGITWPTQINLAIRTIIFVVNCWFCLSMSEAEIR